MHEIVCSIEDNEQVQKKLDPCKDVELHRTLKETCIFRHPLLPFPNEFGRARMGDMSEVERCNKIECMMIAETMRISTTRYVQKWCMQIANIPVMQAQLYSE